MSCPETVCKMKSEKEKKSFTLFKILRGVWFMRLLGGVGRLVCFFCKLFLNQVNLWLFLFRPTLFFAGELSVLALFKASQSGS